MIIYKEIEGTPSAAILGKIALFYASIFSNADTSKFRRKLGNAADIFTVLALEEKRIVGFKLGYRLDPLRFYSWVGGVDKNFRKNGIAGELMKRQHLWCLGRGYKFVRTKTKNIFREMLVLNIKSGFDITEVYKDSRNELKIVLEKDLFKG